MYHANSRKELINFFLSFRIVQLEIFLTLNENCQTDLLPRNIAAYQSEKILSE